jgi:hypothetical protein
MGTFSPSATYIYERSNGRIYARELGKTERMIVGYDTAASQEQLLHPEWYAIFQAAENNPTLQEALDRVKIIYNLSKQHGQ